MVEDGQLGVLLLNDTQEFLLSLLFLDTVVGPAVEYVDDGLLFVWVRGMYFCVRSLPRITTYLNYPICYVI